jgi:O-antigen/teichoic acid export membrane protein
VILAPLGLLQAVGNPVGQIYLAKGRTDLMFLIGMISTVVQVIGYAAGIPWGLHGVVLSYAIANLALIVPGTLVPFRIIGLTYRAFLNNLVPVLTLAGVMALVAFAWETGLEHFGVRQPLFLLASTVVVGVIVYVGLFIKVRPAVLADVLRPLAESGVKPLQRMAARFSPNRESGI